MAQCATDRLVFQDAGRRQVTGRFNGGRLTPDAGVTLLREANRVLGVTERIAQCFVDHRDQARTEHSVQDLVAQRVMALALGYEDLTDHDRLRTDSTLALAVGRKDLTGQQRARARDRAYPLAGSSTLNRMELGCAETAKEDRYKKIVADADAIDELLVDLFVDMHPDGLGEIVLDVDATDIEVHGKQEGGQFNGRVRRWRGALRVWCTCPRAFASASIPAPIGPFPPPSHRTGRANFPHPALQWDHAPRTRNASSEPLPAMPVAAGPEVLRAPSFQKLHGFTHDALPDAPPDLLTP